MAITAANAIPIADQLSFEVSVYDIRSKYGNIGLERDSNNKLNPIVES